MWIEVEIGKQSVRRGPGRPTVCRKRAEDRSSVYPGCPVLDTLIGTVG